MFSVLLKTSAAKTLSNLNDEIKHKILSVLDTLKMNPVPYSSLDVKKLRGYTDFFVLGWVDLGLFMRLGSQIK